MNNHIYRLVFSRPRGMLVAVAETAVATGKADRGETTAHRSSTRPAVSLFMLRHAALGALMLAGAVTAVHAQIVPGGTNAPSVIQTQNGLPQVNVNRPSGGGVSMNTYSQFDVQKSGAILNNSPTVVNTQQAGYVNGNPNFGPGQSARIIVNQVNSLNPSQLRGYVEVAGSRAEVVVANPSGLVIDGGGFINTSRAILTTGVPQFDGSGALTGFDVSGGLVAVQGQGLNASNVDQVDLIARAVQANAAIYGNTLNVVTGANHVDHDTLAATPIAGSGAAPSVAIDVSQLGGMYANRIFLASNEHGVGVSNEGVIAAQVGDLTLTTQGRLVLSGRTTASGNMALSATGGLDNSGTTYAQQGISINTAADLTNSGTLAAQQNTTVNAGTVASTGTLGAGINTDGSIANAGDLNVSASGVLSATGHNAAGGNASLFGASMNLAGAQTSANGNLALSAGAGDLNLTGATTTAGGTLSANAQGTLTNDNGALAASGGQTIVAGALSNAGGQIISQSTLDIHTAGAVNNRQGILQAAGHENVNAASLDNTAGRVVSLNADGLGVSTSGALVNATGTTATGATGGVIGGNGALDLSAASISNQGQIDASGNASVRAQSLVNDAGSIAAGGNLAMTVSGALSNRSGTLSGSDTSVSAVSVDNTTGTIEGDQLALSTTGDLVNRNGGNIRQYGSADQSVSVGGTLDDTGGTIASNANNLNVSAQSLTNDSGIIQHAGTGTLTVTTLGALSNVNGQIATNGALNTQAASLDNTTGSISAQDAMTLDAGNGVMNHGGTLYGQAGLTATTQGAFDNSAGSVQTGGNLSVMAGGALSNANGTISANGAHGAATVSAASIDNTSGMLTNSGDGSTAATAVTGITNTGGTLGGNGDVTVDAQTLTNTANAKLVAGGAANLNVSGGLNNSGGTIYGGTALNINQSGATVTNDGGTLEGSQDISVQVASLSNAGGAIRANRDITASGAMSGDGVMAAGGNLSLTATGDYTNSASNSLHADGNLSVAATGTLTNSGALAAGGATTVSGASVVNQAGADIDGTTTTVNALGSLINAGRIEGNTVTTNSSTLANTGTVIGNTVQVNASDVQNSGAAAVIAAAQTLKIHASNSVSNTDGALIYSAGNLEIAKDGVRDGSGMLADQTGTLTNSASTIEAAGDIDIAAHTVNNLRTGVVTQAGAAQNTGSTTLTLWTGGMSIDELGSYQSSVYSQWNWNPGGIGTESIGKLAQPITVTVPKSQVTNLDATAQTFSLTQPLTDTYVSASTPLVQVCNSHDFCHYENTSATRTITNNATQWYNSIADNGSTYTITFWPDYNPSTNIRPDQVSMRYDLGTDSHDYAEMSRTVTTTGTTDQLVSAGTQATLRAQGAIRINSDGGAINNASSTMAAGGDLIRRATGGSVNDTGTVLQQTITQDAQSTYYWHQKTGGDSDTKVVDDGITQSTTTVAALPAIATANGAVQTGAQTINVASVNRVGQTVSGSGVTGGDATGTQLGNLSGQTHRPQTLGSASGGIPNLTLPVNGLYTYQTLPGSTYLIATDPRLTSYSSFISSNYMLSALGLNPQTTEKRLGDGAYEEQLVMDQVTQLTGRTFLGSYTDNLDEYTALMNNGVAYAKAFDLTPGVGLTDAQMQQLTTDMVWLVSQTVTLPDGTQQTVLVPRLYLAQGDTVDLQDSGAIVAGNAVSLNATGDVSNSGHIVSDVATTVLGNNIVNSGVIGSSGTTTVAAVQDVRNVSGRIGGAETVVLAGRDVVDETATSNVSNTLHEGGFTSSASSQSTQATGTISASDNAVVLAGRDVNLAGAAIQSGNNTFVGAGRNINVGTTTLAATQDAGTNDGLNGGHDGTTKNVGSTITTGGSFTSVSGGDTTLTDATVKSGSDATLIAANNLTVTAATDTHSHNEQSLGGPLSKHTSSSYDETVQGSNLNAGNNLTLGAGQTATASGLLSQYHVSVAGDAPGGGGNLSVLGSSATTGSTAADGTTNGGVTTLAATGDVTIGSVSETHDSQSWSHTDHSGFLSSDKTTDRTSSHTVDAAGSTVSGDTVSAMAGHDLTIAGSTVASTNDMALSAGHDLTITTTQDTSESSHFHEETKSGLGATGGAGISYGTSDTKDTTNDSSVAQNGSLVGSTNGSVRMTAGNNLHITGSDVIAAQDVTGTAANVIIDAATGTNHHDETQETKTSGFTLGIGGSVGQAISSAVDQAHAEGDSQDGRAKALHAIAAVGNAGDAAGQLASGGTPDVSIELSWGTSQSKNTFTEDQATQTGSTVKAGGTVAFTATGNDTPGSGNITIAGSDVSGKDVALTAKDQVNLLNSTNADSTRSTNKSSSASVGVSYGTKGWGVSASMSNAHGDANSDAATQNNTHVTASNAVLIVSGGDTNIIGADVSGKHVSADVGGNLNIASIQDTTQSSAHQESTSGGFSISQGGGSASFSSQHGSASGSYAAVSEQAGIQAGTGGFDINVKGNTDLTGAYIASDADPTRNTLTTGTLTYSNIQNHSDYSSSTSGFSASTQGATPMIGQSDSGHSSATAKSAVSPGTITLTNAAGQTQDVASLNRDTSSLNGTVAKLPDVSTVLGKETDVMNAANAAGEAVAKDVGTYADYREKSAKDGAKAANLLGETDQAAQYQQDAADWSEGGADRVGMHIVAGAVIGGLGGGGAIDALGGAAGAGLSATLAPKLNDLSQTIADADPTGNATVDRMLGQGIANVVAGAAGAAVGGNAGAFTASNTDMYNRQLHQSEYDLAKKEAKLVAQQLGISVEDAEGRIVAELQRNVDGQTAQADGGVHDYQVRSILGCQMLECNASSIDPNYWNHGYNSQYIASNQVAYTLGLSQGTNGQTYNGLVTSNVQNNPISTAIAGAGMIGLGTVTGAGLATLGMMGAGSTIGMAANGGVQLYNSQPFDWAGFGMAGLTGGASTGMGFIPALLINTGGALASSAIAGQNPNGSMAGAAAGTAVGYPLGAAAESGLNKALNPWYRQEWIDIGIGISKYVPESLIPSWAGAALGGVAQEKAGGAVQNKVDGATNK
ncbi:two-partner secretion domain-containing protein [Paraburkholderia sartisoli]|uniref:Filamentous hemagglutinin n=1 Tax=Paraburkholderia sartisoli TaxID=83784 RepID=A0A1H3YHM8_9BURK|nr:hemagglutinin repeat-containing protein [Paraburkholderia sartisoli]SEA11119.1 filamentous hemagglutinin [Paraburkholderia sartisoli]